MRRARNFARAIPPDIIAEKTRVSSQWTEEGFGKPEQLKALGGGFVVLLDAVDPSLGVRSLHGAALTTPIIPGATGEKIERESWVWNEYRRL